MIRWPRNNYGTAPRLEHAPFPKVIRSGVYAEGMNFGLEHAPFPKVIRWPAEHHGRDRGLEHAPFPKVIRFRDSSKVWPR